MRVGSLHRLDRCISGGGCWPVSRSNTTLNRKSARRCFVNSRRYRLCVRSAAVGIDLGTSNSAVAVLVEGEPKVIPVDNEKLSIPSVVAYDKEGHAIVGADATSLADPLNTFYAIKRIIGKSFEEVESESDGFVYKVVGGGSGEVLLHAPNKGLIKPEEISSLIVRKLLDTAEDFVGEKVDKAVITVPAYFNIQQKAATITAAGLAGLDDVALLQEPIAAALAYGLGRPRDQDTILVLDMGGGTYDVSILESFEGIMEVVSTAGDSHLGGEDYDQAIAEWISTQASLHGVEYSMEDPGKASELLRIAEQAKIDIVEDGHAGIRVSGGIGEAEFALDGAEFDRMTRTLSDRLWPPLKAIRDEAIIAWFERPDSNPEDEKSQPASKPETYAPPPRRVTKVVLAGGSSKLPMVKELVSKITNIGDLRCPVEPKLCVALGAAVFAGMMQGEVGGIEIMDGAYASDMHDRVSGFQAFH